MYENPRSLPPQHLMNTASVRAKVEQDITFLSDRITTLKAQTDPNQVVIDTYQTMLDSRRSVLTWLQQDKPRHTDEAPTAGV